MITARIRFSLLTKVLPHTRVTGDDSAHFSGNIQFINSISNILGTVCAVALVMFCHVTGYAQFRGPD